MAYKPKHLTEATLTPSEITPVAWRGTIVEEYKGQKIITAVGWWPFTYRNTRIKKQIAKALETGTPYTIKY